VQLAGQGFAKVNATAALDRGSSRVSGNDTLPLVSIVIPHHNRAELLAETLRSVEAQEYPNWEVVVVDDGSEPDQWTAIQRYAKQGIRILQRTDGIKGPSRCRNLGAAAARGEYLVFLDSDDLLAPWCLAQRMEIARAAPRSDLWIFQVLLFRESSGDMDVCWNRLGGDDDLERFLRSDPPWHTSSPIWRKRAFLELGGFNEKVMYGDDSNLHLKALLRTVPRQKHSDWLPDTFIRRGQQQRITSGLSSSLAASRRTRLTEGKKLLQQLHASQDAHDLWEGQFFVECEELLFNASEPSQPIERVLSDWAELHHPPRLRQWVVRSYFKIGPLLRVRAYLALRIVRRLARMTLPSRYFPTGGNFQSWALSEKAMQQVRHKLASNDPVPMPAATQQHAAFPGQRVGPV